MRETAINELKDLIIDFLAKEGIIVQEPLKKNEINLMYINGDLISLTLMIRTEPMEE